MINDRTIINKSIKCYQSITKNIISKIEKLRSTKKINDQRMICKTTTATTREEKKNVVEKSSTNSNF